MTQTFRSLTPPKYAAALGDRQAKVLLEERLLHFIKWLDDKGVQLYDVTTGSPVDGPRLIHSDAEIDNWIQEYVNE